MHSSCIACLTPSSGLQEGHKCSGSSASLPQNRQRLGPPSILKRCRLNQLWPVRNWISSPNVGRPDVVMSALVRAVGNQILVCAVYESIRFEEG